MTVTDHADSAGTRMAGVRVCDSCGRPVTARDKNEYTVNRARLIVEKGGLCVCQTRAPVRSPSLI